MTGTGRRWGPIGARVMVWGLLLAILTMGGCASMAKPVEQSLPAPLPGDWTMGVAVEELPIASMLLDLINEKTLKDLVQEALSSNPDLKATAFRLEAEGYLLNGPRSRLFPRVSTEFSKGRGNQSVDEQTGEKRTADSHRLSLGVSWEIDLWGRLADEYASANHALTASKEDYLNARDALAARVIQTWIEQVANRRAVSIESDRVSVLAHIEGVLIDRYRDGIGSLDEYSAAKSRTQIARADLSIQQTTWRESTRRLEVLLGRSPQGAPPTGNELPSVAPPPIHAPVSVMRHRPDIRAAMARVESARRLSRAADKAMLPGVTLTGELFRSTASLGNIGSSTTYWGILGAVFQPLFEGGRLMGAARARRSEADAALLELYGMVLRALKEVEDRLDLDRELAIQSAALESAVRESEISSRYFAERYRQGLDSIQNLLIAKEQEMSVKIRLNQVDFQRLSNRIDLALALGVGVTGGE